MKFSIKIFICMIVTVAVAFAIGGFLIISTNFSAAKDREISRALDEHLSVNFMLESAIITRELQELSITDTSLRDAAQDVANGIQLNRQNDRSIVIYDGKGAKTFPAADKEDFENTKAFSSLTDKQVVYQIKKDGSTYRIYVTGPFSYNNAKIYLSYSRDISEIFIQRDTQVRAFMIYQLIITLLSSGIALGMSLILTSPIRRLTNASRRIASGKYGQRANIRSSDEIGELAQSFNSMAESVEGKIHQLENASREKDDFIANFTHELKTPMTSIIGYADMLRTRQLEPADLLKSANYIYNEASRLESLSLKMLDLVMLEKQNFEFIEASGAAILEYVYRSALPAYERAAVSLNLSTQKGYVMVEPDLIKTLLINLLDNARKASHAGSSVDLTGSVKEGEYTFTVLDHGDGIPEKEIGKIMEAFYMVDKSRSRAQHGSGLGLAISGRIASLHNTALDFKSQVGKGTCVSFNLPCTLKQGGLDHD